MFYETLENFFDQFSHLVQALQNVFIGQRAKMYSEAVKNAGKALDTCVGFIRATNIFNARSQKPLQRATYSGHKKKNALKIEAISLTNCLISSLEGPVEARRHDITLYRISGIEAYLMEGLTINDAQYYLYGDPSYSLRAFWLYHIVGCRKTWRKNSVASMSQCHALERPWSGDLRIYENTLYMYILTERWRSREYTSLNYLRCLLFFGIFECACTDHKVPSSLMFNLPLLMSTSRC